MSQLAVADTDWVRVSGWEVEQEGWTRTRAVLDSYTRLASEGPQSWLPDLGRAEQGPLVFKLLCGADLLESFAVPGLWETEVRVVMSIQDS